MEWQQGLGTGRGSDRHGDRRVQFVPAEKGWLALFEEATPDGQLRIHADPVVAWRLTPNDRHEAHMPLMYGQAVVGASPWLEKADSEHSANFFALVREDQLDPDFLAELKAASYRSREQLMTKAQLNHDSRNEGHASWRRQRRSLHSEKAASAHFGIFTM